MGLMDLFNDDTGIAAARSAFDRRKAGLTQGTKQAGRLIDRGVDRARGYYDKSADLYDPLYSTASKGYGAFADAMGLNGPAGNERAVGRFQAGPGYEFTMDQGLDALDRRAASRGMLASGNNTQDILRFSQGLADQEYDQWLDRLSGYGSDAATFASGKSGAYDRLAQLFANAGGTKADLVLKRNIGIGDAGAQMEGDVAQAKYASGANILNTLFGAAELGAKAFGMGGYGAPTGGA
jgi:hypothetical protein